MFHIGATYRDGVDAGQHAHAVTGQAAENRRGRGRTEARSTYAGLASERLADTDAHFTSEVGFIKHGDPTEHVFGTPANARDNDLVVVVVVMRFFRSARLGLRGGNRRIARRGGSGIQGDGNGNCDLCRRRGCYKIGSGLARAHPFDGHDPATRASRRC